MGRKRVERKRRTVFPDPKYLDVTVAKFTNMIMTGGNKSVAQKILYDSFELIQQRLSEDPVKVFKKALDNIKPNVEVRSRRVGGANYQIPVEVKSFRKQALAMRWLRDYAKDRSEKTMVEKMAAEIIEAYNKRGGAMKKRDDTHRMAEANQAFAHFQW